MTKNPTSNPTPTQRHYAALGVHHGETVERCIEAFEQRIGHYDPRLHPADAATQHLIIGHQDDLDEALALIVDADRLAEVAV